MKNNSITQILATLSTFEFLTENEIFIETFNYNRNTSWNTNKKYSYMLRRGLTKGFVGRANNNIVKCREDIGKATFVYFLTKKGEEFLKASSK
jgi:predicted transcriptional regulator